MANIYIGTRVPSNIYVGTSEVQSVYIGIQKIWEKPSGEFLIYNGGSSLIRGTSEFRTTIYNYGFYDYIDTTYCTITNGKIKCIRDGEGETMSEASAYGKFVIQGLDWSNFTQIHLNVGAVQWCYSSIDNYWLPKIEFTTPSSEDISFGTNNFMGTGDKEYTFDLPEYDELDCNAIAIIGGIEVSKIWLT